MAFARPLSTLRLRFVVRDGHAEWPVVQILVDGTEAFVDRLPEWHGFDPADLLGNRSPLLPQDLGRRVALYRCSCGIAGCGVIAPFIVPSPDGRRVSWVDFRDYVGVFDTPTAPAGDRHEGSPWPFEDRHFDRGQYVAEVERASADRSWETPRRAAARLVADGLRAADVTIPPDLRPTWVAPAWDGDGLRLSFDNGRPGDAHVQRILHLTSDRTDPERVAADVLAQLLATLPHEWYPRYGWHR